MQKSYNIKWRKSDADTLAKAVRKFNAKRTRLLKQVPELIDFLPEKLSVKDIKSKTATRRDFNNTINSINRFMKKGSEKPVVNKEGVKTTKYMINEMQIKIRTINKRRADEKKKAAPSHEKGTMGVVKQNNLNPKKFNFDKMDKSDWKAFIKAVEKQASSRYTEDKIERYKENYLKALETAFGIEGNIIADIVSNIDGETLKQLYYDDPVLQLDFIYDPIELSRRVDAIVEHFADKGYYPSTDEWEDLDVYG